MEGEWWRLNIIGLLVVCLFMTSGNVHVLGQLPLCSESEYVCPVSKACFQRDHVCDSYDDCGTRFDESSCPGGDASASYCKDVQVAESQFNSACVADRITINGTDEAGNRTRIVTDGTLYFPFDQVFIYGYYVDTIRFNTAIFPAGEFGYALFTIRLVGLPQVSDEVFTIAVSRINWSSQEPYWVEARLRTTIGTNPLVFERIEVSVYYVVDAVPSAASPYLTPAELYPWQIELKSVHYYYGCGNFSVPGTPTVAPAADNRTGNACLEAVEYYAHATTQALLAGFACEPTERVEFAYLYYEECFDPPLPVQPVRQPPALPTLSPVTVPTSSTSAPPTGELPLCLENELVCPVSRACYKNNHICDSYDDCGTGFDESSCPHFGDVGGAYCADVMSNETQFNIVCAADRRALTATNATGQNAPTTDGRVYVAIPEVYGYWIEAIRINTSIFFTSPREIGFALFTIRVIGTGNFQDQIVTLAVSRSIYWQSEEPYSVEIRLRAPIRVNPFAYDRIEITVAYVIDAQPSPTSPYITPTHLHPEDIAPVVVQYYSGCAEAAPTTSPSAMQNACLEAAASYANATRRALLAGIACEPTERVNIVYESYIECFDPFLPDQPVRQPLPVPTVPAEVTELPFPTYSPTAIPTEPPSPCPEDKLTCPVSQACYITSDACDSYDNCGTGFDESNCSELVENELTCALVRQNASLLYSSCSTVSQFYWEPYPAGPNNPYILNGRVVYNLPEFTQVWVESIVFNTLDFASEGYPGLFVMFTISAYNRRLDQVDQSVGEPVILTAYREINSSLEEDLQEVPLSVPMFIDPALADSIQISVVSAYATIDESLEPHLDLPYSVPSFLQAGAIRVKYTQYAEFTNEQKCNYVSDRCLSATWDFLRTSEEASQLGATCIQPKLTAFYSSLYGDCFEPPRIQQIPSDTTDDPGAYFEVVCLAAGRPAPAVEWVSDSDLNAQIRTGTYQPAQNQVQYGYSAFYLGVTNATDLSLECRARNLLGEVSAQTSITATSITCMNLTGKFSNFQSETLVPPCFNLGYLQSSSSFLRQGGLVLRYSAQTDGLLYSVELPAYAFRGGFGDPPPISAAQVQVRYEPPPVEYRRRRRSIVPIVYEHDHFDIPDYFYTYYIVFNHPIRVTAGHYFTVTVRSLDPIQTIRGTQGPINIQYLRCSGTVNEVRNASCLTIYESWRGLEERNVTEGCASNYSALFELYRECLRESDQYPTVGEVVAPQKIYSDDDFTIMCPITGGFEVRWYRRTSRGHALPFPLPSPILRFDSFNANDQGEYFCEATGGGRYSNLTWISEPISLILEDVATLLVSVTFNRTYIDITDPIFTGVEADLIGPVISALEVNETSLLAQSLYRGPDGRSNPVTIIDTRPGSLVINYQVRFNESNWSENQTGLVDEVSGALLDHLTPESYPDVVAESISVGMASTCPASVITRNRGTVTFPSVVVGQTAESVEHCADYTGNVILPRATRFCRGNLLTPAVWEDPVFIDCFVEEMITDQTLVEIANTTVTPDNVAAYSSDLVTATNQSATISSEGLAAVATSLENIVEVQDPSEEVTINVINTVSNVLDVGEEDYSMSMDDQAPTRILDSLEMQVTLFQTMGAGTNLTIVEPQIAVVAVQLPSSSVQSGIGFATIQRDGGEALVADDLNENLTMLFLDTDLIPQAEVEASIVLPAAIFDFIPTNITGNGMVPVTFFIFQNSLLFQTLAQDVSSGSNTRQAIGSRIISATIEGVVIENLPRGQEVETVFLELNNVTNIEETIDNRSCVFWEKTSSGGRWSTEGCRREDDTDVDRIRCLCDHLTSFAVLLDISGDSGYKVLEILGIIGCIVSIVCLTILLITYLSVKKIHSRQPQRIHINLCVALWCLYFVFVIGIDRRYPEAGCVIAGFLIHFFMLSSMAWMLAEAVYMYMLFVTVHSGSVSKYLRIAGTLAWGLPLFVCVIVVCVDRSYYLGDDTYCFVQPGPALYYGVLLPVGIVLLANNVIFVLVAYSLTCGRRFVSKAKNKRADTWRTLQDLLTFTILLGLTWIFGFLAIGDARFLFNLLFLIFNSLQGFFVFLAFGVRQKLVRDVWREWCLCACARGENRSSSYQSNTKSKPTGTTDSGDKSSSLDHSTDDMLLENRGNTKL